MEQDNKPVKSPVTLRDVITDQGVQSFFGFYGVYKWLSTEEAKSTLVDAFNIKFFAIFKACILLAAMGSMILGGYRLVQMWLKLKKTIKIVDIDPEPKTK